MGKARVLRPGESDMAQDGTAGDVNVGGSQGVVAGTGNTQINNWALRAPLTPATLAALSPHAAVTRIRQMSHDDAVDLFASASAEVLKGKLRALLAEDEAMAVAILADLEPASATELIRPHQGDFSWLVSLPSAAEGIAQRAVSLRWVHEAGTGRVERAPQSPRGTEGYFRQYQQGGIYWRQNGNRTYVVRGAIAEFHLASGGTGGYLGFPRTEEISRVTEPGTEGTVQEFECGGICSSRHGTHSVSTEFIGAGAGLMGFPLAAAEADDGVESQRFEYGVMYSWTEGTFAVRPEVVERARGWVPVSAEEDVYTGQVQRFKPALASAEMAVYSSEATGAQRVVGRKLAFYEELGGPRSGLGFPAATASSYRGGYVQRFEHGWIFDRSGYDPVVVPAETLQSAELNGDRLGWPVSPEKPVGGSAEETIQYFENGVVTLRDGNREIWLRPQS
jgi:hypothetical protein